jgi:mycothiol synthase
MIFSQRKYQQEEDFWLIRNFLRAAWLLNDGREHCWHVAWLDYWRWHAIENLHACAPLEEVVFIWETPSGEIAGVLHPEEAGDVYLQVHPCFRLKELEREMLECAETHLSVRHDDHQELYTWARADDALRQDLLRRRGYKPGKWTTHVWRRNLDGALPEVSLPPGYRIRSVGSLDDLPGRSLASWRGFHLDAPEGDYEGWEWYLNIQRCPLYRRDLDLVVEAPSGEIASFCTFWYDDVTRSAYIEPVATVPQHQRLGLARACITEGLRRVQRLGVLHAHVTGMEPGPNALYALTLSPEHDRFDQWLKCW